MTCTSILCRWDREPALSVGLSLSPHARPWAGPTSLHPIAQSGRVLAPRNEDLEEFGGGRVQTAIRLTRVRRYTSRPVVSAAQSMRGLEV
jgi:hypothetical protein